MPENILDLDPATTTLLVMDLQPAILAYVPDADGLVARVADAVASARTAGIPVVFVRVALTDDERAAVPTANKTFARMAAAGLLADGDPANALHPSLAAAEGEVTVRKSRTGAFSTTSLLAHLDGRTTVVLAGTATSGVVLSTVRDAADRDLRIVVLADGVADPDPEVHDILIRKVLPSQADVVQIADFRAALS